MDQPIEDPTFVGKVLRARAMPLKEKMFVGAELFDYACSITKVGIRMQHPEADEAQVLELLRRRIELGKRLEQQR